MLRVKCSVGDQVVAYLHRTGDEGSVECLLSNGQPASLEYAGILKDAHLTELRLEPAKTSGELAAFMREIGKANYIYEPLPEPRTLLHKSIEVKCTDTVYKQIVYVYRKGDTDCIHCKTSSGAAAKLDRAGVLSDAQGTAFALEAARTSEELASLLYQIGSKRFEYEPR
jgi:hypothetical protein